MITVDQLVEKAVSTFRREHQRTSAQYIQGWLDGYWRVAIDHHAELGSSRPKFIEQAKRGIYDYLLAIHEVESALCGPKAGAK